MKQRGLGRSVREIELLACLIAIAAVSRSTSAFATPSGQVEQASAATPIGPGSTAMEPAVLKTPPEVQGDILMAQRQYQSAIKSFQQAPQNSAVVLNKTGVAYHHLYDMVAAKSHYEKALRLDPKYPAAMNNLATALYAGKQYGSAEKLYKKALKLSPRDATIHGNLGTLYFVEGKTDKGAAAYREAFALDPNVFERGAATSIGEGVSAQQRSMMNYSLAKTYAGAGSNARALEYLRLAFSEGFKDRRKLLEEKEFATLRETPEFRQLMQEHH